MLHLWLITSPDDFSAEFDDIEQMFGRGLSRLILSKRGRNGAPATENDYERWLLGLPMEFRDRIWVRGNPDMAERLEVRGCVCECRSLLGDLPKRWWRSNTLALCDSQERIADLPPWVAGALLGPVFQPLSAIEPVQNLLFDQLNSGPGVNNPEKIPLVLFGGMDQDNLESVIPFAPSGLAFLGGIWNYADPVNAFIKLKRTLDSLNSRFL